MTAASKADLVLIGCGGHAKVVLEAIWARTPKRRVIVLDDNPAAGTSRLLGVPVLGTRDWLLGANYSLKVVAAIGDNRARLSLIRWIAGQNFGMETVIHPSAVLGSTVEIGRAAFLSAGSIVIADSKIGRGAIINTGASIDHDCVIGEAAHIGPGVRLCGNVTIGPRSLLGVGVAVRPGISIGADVVVGAGSTVVSDLPDAGVYIGSPARRFKS